MEKSARSSKKQRELLLFIDGFIKGNNYGPSYREIMRALGYKSVSTVAVHVDGLITKGYLRKADNSARSLEVITHEAVSVKRNAHLTWLGQEIERCARSGLSEADLDTLRSALSLLDSHPSRKKP